MLSSELPSVKAAKQYLNNLDHGGMIGGRPQMNRPNKNNSKQAMDIGNHSIVKRKRINIFINPEAVVDLIWSS